MNIYSKPGTRVRFTNEEGRPSEQVSALRKLKLGKVYTIKDVEVYSYKTEILLEETAGIFNSVLFEDLE